MPSLIASHYLLFRHNLPSSHYLCIIHHLTTMHSLTPHPLTTPRLSFPPPHPSPSSPLTPYRQHQDRTPTAPPRVNRALKEVPGRRRHTGERPRERHATDTASPGMFTIHITVLTATLLLIIVSGSPHSGRRSLGTRCDELGPSQTALIFTSECKSSKSSEFS